MTETLKLDDVWAELDSRAQAQERVDLRWLDENDITDDFIAAVLKTGILPEGGGRFCDWRRRQEARNRQKSGQLWVSMRHRYGGQFAQITTARPRNQEPGSGPQEDL